MATSQPRGMQQTEGRKKSFTPTYVAKVLGLNRETYRKIPNAVQSKWDALEIGDTNTVYLQVIK